MSNPYQPSAAPLQVKQPMMHGGMGNPMQPLHSVAGWLIFIGWFNLVFGILYALTVVGIIFAWVPIWIGICLKNAGESLKVGYPANDTGRMFNASTNLATTFRIVGVLCIINLVVLALYLVFIIIMFVGMFAAAAAAAS